MKKIYISPGDPSGIGPEITLKALARNKSIQDNFIIGGDANYFEDFAKKLKLNLKINEEGSQSEGLKIKHFPSMYKDIIDPIGCGDAFFVMTSIIKNVCKDLDLINFMGNLYAGMHAMHEGNKRFVHKKEFLNTMKSLLS